MTKSQRNDKAQKTKQRTTAERLRLPFLLLALGALCVVTAPVQAERIKDIVDIQGVRGNPLWGYGLVIGLNGTGDDSEASRRAMANLLRKGGLTLTPSDVASKNIASVLVTAELGPFSRKGSTLDVTVSAIGNTSSLQGGTLLMTSLQGADGTAYAVAQGQLVIGGFGASGESASVTKNHTTVGRIAAGATVEKEELADFVEKGQMILQLKNADFTTAERIAKAINDTFAQSSVAADGGTVVVQIPKKTTKGEIAKFIDTLGALQVEVDNPAVVVINERTGTIIVGENVRISMVAITHGSLVIAKAEKESVVQPPPFAPKGARTEKERSTEVSAQEEHGTMRVVPRQVSVAELAHALNAMGLTPRDLISIFEELRQAGALQAQLKVR